jgi:acyl transferase domain-containing protein
MKRSKLAVLFPGQGAFYPGALKEASREYPAIRDVFAEIDSVAKARLSESVTGKLWDPKSPDIDAWLKDAPGLLQLAIYAVSVSMYRVLALQALNPDVLMGHSFGEIAALVCAGSFSISQGAEIVIERTAALAKLAKNGGYMAALGSDAVTAEKLLKLAGNHEAVIAVENYSAQTVLSGGKGTMDTVSELARVLRLPFVKLNSPYPFHSPAVAPAVAEFAVSIRRFVPAAPRVPVFSPIMQRYYGASDVLTDCLAEHLVRPVRFGGALQQLCSEGARTFIECGALDALTRIAAKAIDAPDVVTISCLKPEAGELASLGNALRQLGKMGLISTPPELERTALQPMPGREKDLFDQFWTECGERFKSYAKAEFESFRQQLQADTNGSGLATAEVEHVVPQPRTAVQDDFPQRTNAISREQLFRELVSVYAQALEYPEDVFTEDVELEAELGIDSVKQTELLARVSEQYQLPPRPSDFRLAAYNTMGKITDFIYRMSQLNSASVQAPSAGGPEPPKNGMHLSVGATVDTTATVLHIG